MTKKELLAKLKECEEDYDKKITEAYRKISKR